MENNIKVMQDTVEKVMEQYQGVNEFLDSMETAKAQHAQAITELEEQVAGLQETFSQATDLTQAKQLKNDMDSITDEIELVKQVNKAKVFSMLGTLSEKAVAVLKANTEAVAMFKELDNEMVANTSLKQLQANIELMQSFASDINNSFRGVRNILLDTKLVATADQNKVYAGIHLGRAGIQSELVAYEIKVRSYMRELIAKGVSL